MSSLETGAVVLRCSLCNKPFDSPATLRRHGYYCRSRKLGSNGPRLRSCTFCVKRKVRCDHKQPQCGKCVAKGVDCYYEPVAKSPVKSQQADQHVAVVATESPKSFMFDESMLDFSSIWMDPCMTELPVPDLLDNNYIPLTLSRKTRQLTSKSLSMTSATPSLILSTLGSFARIRDSPPPFVHPCFSSESVQNCQDIMNMRSRRLFWSAVTIECERMMAEVLQLDRFELLGCFQALAVYVLVRIDEGETEFNNIDTLLLSAVLVLSKQFRWGSVDHGDVLGLWQEWIYQESITRICSIYQVLGMVVNFEPTKLCDNPVGIRIAPLPSKKQLWEATDARSWMMERDKCADIDECFALSSNGQLLKINKAATWMRHTQSPSILLDSSLMEPQLADWGEWCPGMDGLGSLIMLAAVLE